MRTILRAFVDDGFFARDHQLYYGCKNNLKPVSGIELIVLFWRHCKIEITKVCWNFCKIDTFGSPWIWSAVLWAKCFCAYGSIKTTVEATQRCSKTRIWERFCISWGDLKRCLGMFVYLNKVPLSWLGKTV